MSTLTPQVQGHNAVLLAIALLLVYLSVTVISKVFIYPLLLSPLRRLPSPKKPHFLFGHGSAVLGKPPGAEMLGWADTIPNEGLIRFRGYLNQDSLLITAPAALADVLQKNCYDFEKPAKLRSFLGQVQGDGLSVVEGDVHKFQRKNLNPAFHIRQIKELYPVFWEQSQKLVHVLRRTSGPFEMGEYASRASMDIIGIAALGRELNTLEDPAHPVMEQFAKLFEFTPQNVLYFGANMVLPQALVEWMPVFKDSKRTLRTSASILREEAKGMVRDKKRSKLDADILSVILRSNSFPDDNLEDQLITFLAAGHETTANALTWTSYLLALHPDIQDRLRDEVLSAIPNASDTAKVSAALLESLPLLHGVICEGLRLFPGAPILLREAVRDTAVIGQLVPKGTQVILSPWVVNRSRALWGSDATEFKPERWSDLTAEGTRRPNNNGGADSNYSFLTFLQGPRRCIGENFSRAELRCLVASVVGSFHLEMAPGKRNVTASGVVGLKPAEGVWLNLTPVV